mgnify:FL=1
MRVFKEEQSFRQWWVLFILGSMLLGCCLVVINNFTNSSAKTMEFVALGIIIIVSLLFWKLKLRTKIDATGIKARFEPTSFFRKEFKWNEISKCYVRKYVPVAEYGGWGIRGLGKTRAYNVSGNMGIQIFTIDKKNFLIGTNKPEEANKVLRRYQEKIKNHE